MRGACAFFSLPDALVSNICSEWLAMVDFCFLDTAVCHREFRNQFLALGKDCVFSGIDCMEYNAWFQETFIRYLLKRGFRVSSIFLGSDSRTGPNYLVLFGKHIITLTFIDTFGEFDTQIFGFVCLHCPNLLKVTIPSTVPINMVVRLGIACNLVRQVDFSDVDLYRGKQWTLAEYKNINAAYPNLDTSTVYWNTSEVYTYMLQEFPKLQKLDIIQYGLDLVRVPVEINLTKFNMVLKDLTLYVDICTEVLNNILRHCPNLQRLDVTRCSTSDRLDFGGVALYCPRLTYLAIHLVFLPNNVMHAITQRCPLLKQVILSGNHTEQAKKLLPSDDKNEDHSQAVFVSTWLSGLTVQGLTTLRARGVTIIYDY